MEEFASFIVCVCQYKMNHIIRPHDVVVVNKYLLQRSQEDTLSTLLLEPGMNIHKFYNLLNATSFDNN